MSSASSKVCAVVVTYAERWQLLEQVIRALQLQRAPVHTVVVIGNGQPYDLAERLAPLTDSAHRIVTITYAENLGSAAGYKAGIARAAAEGAELIWLLDDDNVPRPDALEQLLRARQLLGDDDRHLFAAFRPDREKYCKVAYEDAALTAGLTDTFMGFRPTVLPRMILDRLRRRRGIRPTRSLLAPIKRIDYAVYGGLLLPRIWVERVGYPDEAYVLYNDDREYTTRIARAGGQIYLVATSVVEDIDTSWHIHADTRRVPALFDPQAGEDRVFYAVRNLVRYDLTYTVRRRWRYLANITVFTMLQTAVAVTRKIPPTLVIGRLRLISRAVIDGLQGKVGPRQPRSVTGSPQEHIVRPVHSPSSVQ